jgi:PAS domain S-box-containing protein
MPAKDSTEKLLIENAKLREELEELREIIRAVKSGEVDALVIQTKQGDKVFTLKTADQTYRSLIEEMREGAVMLSDDNIILYCNCSFGDMVKNPINKLMGTNIQNLISPMHLQNFLKLLKQGRKGTGKQVAQVTLQAADDTLVPTQMSADTLEIENSKSTYVVVTDLSKHMEDELKTYTGKLEKAVEEKTRELKNVERMAAIGQTAGMVGHDIRNPLQTIIGELFLARDELKQMPDGPSQKQMKEMLETIEEQTLYINKIVTDLQDFTKPVIPQFQQANVEKLVKDTLKTIKIPATITTSVKIQKNLPDLLIDPSMTQRILTNLFNNAIQAIPETGEVTITASRQNQHAIIAVTDTGTGIPDEIKPKLFQPLFTTKARGQGFGLPVVKRLVEAQNGEITFQSEKGKGTTFTIKLPTQNNKP